MTATWTPERRARQADLIRTWQPWARSTGPRTAAGKAKAARNAWKGGYRQAYRAEIAELRLMLEEEIQFTRDLARRVTT